MTTALTVASIQQACKQLRLPAIAGQCGPLAEAAERERQPYLGYLEALLGAELEEREQHTVARRLREAHLPRLKTLRRLRLSPSGGGLSDAAGRACRGWLHRAGGAGGLHR